MSINKFDEYLKALNGISVPILRLNYEISPHEWEEIEDPKLKKKYDIAVKCRICGITSFNGNIPGGANSTCEETIARMVMES